MADAAVQEAIYSLRYTTGDSVRELREARQAAEQLTNQNTGLASSEEHLSRTTLNYLSALNPRMKAEQQAARYLEHFSQLHRDGAISNERYAETIRRVEVSLKGKIAALDGSVSLTSRLHDNIGMLITRYTGWAIVIRTVTSLARTAAEHDKEAKAAVEGLSQAWIKLSEAAAPPLTFMVNRLTDILNLLNSIPAAAADAGRGMSQSQFLGRDTAHPEIRRTSGFPFADFGNIESSINVTPAQDIKAFEKWQKDREDAIKEQLELHKQFWNDVREVENNAYERSTKTATEYWKGVDAIRDRDEKELDDFHTRAEAAWEKHYERIFKEADDHWKEVDKLREESGRDYERQLEREREKVTRYWDDVTHQMDAAGKDFFTEFAQTGILNFKSLTDKMLSTWTSTLYDMAKQGKLFGEGGLFGGSGGGFGGILNSVGSFIGKWGGLIGAGVGLIQKIFQSKPSDNRSVATFMPGMTDFGFGAQSAHETSQASLGGVQQAAELIRQQILAFKQVGIEFTSQLSNIWLGERDASTFQLAGGQRVSAGSVGDPTDLANDVLAALLKSATSSDPAIAKMLAGGADIAQIQQALAFSLQITDALAQITDPLKYAIDLWKKESQARLDMAAATGFSIDKVQQLNAALYQQITQQQNAGALASIGGLIDQIEYGPGSSKAPGTQYASALADYEAAKKAAMGGGAAEAQAYAQVTSSFLPFAREYLGTSQAYGAIETGALNTLKGLQTSLSSSTAPSLQPVVQQVALSGAQQVEVGNAIVAEVRELRGEVARSNAMFGSVMAKFAATTP